MRSIPELLIAEGFILFPEDTNLIQAERAFVAARGIKWIRERASDPDFNLQSYLVALTYYRLGMAELKFTEENDLVYRYIGVEVEEIVDQLAQSPSRSVGAFHRPDEPPPRPTEETPDD